MRRALIKVTGQSQALTQRGVGGSYCFIQVKNGQEVLLKLLLMMNVHLSPYNNVSMVIGQGVGEGEGGRERESLNSYISPGRVSTRPVLFSDLCDYHIHTDANKSLTTLVVKHYNDLLDRQSSEQGSDEVTFSYVGTVLCIHLGTM